MRTLLRVFAISTILLVTGCSAGASTAEGDSAGPPGVSDGGAPVEEPQFGYDEGAEQPGSDLDGESGPRQMITSVAVRMTVEDPRARATDVATLAERVGGWVAQRSVQAGDDDDAGYATMTVRVPSEELEGLIAQLEELGTVDNLDQESSDVTDTIKDLDARIRALEISVARLEDLLARAETTAAIIEAEQVLTDRQGELEAMLSQRAGLAGRVAMATLEIEMYTEDSVPPEPPTGFFAGLSSGWASLVAAITSGLTGLGVALPWLVFLGLLALVVAALVRRWARSRPQRPERPVGPPAGGPTTSLPLDPQPRGAASERSAGEGSDPR